MADAVGKLKKAHWPVKALIALAVLLLLLSLVRGIDQPHFSPFSTSWELKSVMSLSADTGGAVLTDGYGKRLLFCDSAGRLMRIVEMGKNGYQADVARKVHIFGDGVYVIATKQINGGINIKAESVLEYDLGGNFRREIMHLEHGEGEYCENPVYQDISDDGETTVVLTAADNTFSLIKADPASENGQRTLTSETVGNPIARADFVKQFNIAVIRDRFNKEYYYDLKTGKLDAEKPDYSRTVERISNAIDMTERTDETADMMRLTALPILSVTPIGGSVDETPEYYYAIAMADNSVYGYDVKTGKAAAIKTLALHPLLFAFNLLFWLSAAIIAVFIVFGAVVFFRRHRIHGMKAVLIIALILVAVTVFFTSRERNGILERQRSMLITTAKITERMISDLYGNWFARPFTGYEAAGGDRGNAGADGTDRDMINGMHGLIRNICTSQNDEMSSRIVLFRIAENGDIYFVADSMGVNPAAYIGYNWNDVGKEYEKLYGNVGIIDGLLFEQYITLLPIYGQDGRVTGLIEACSNRGNIISMFNSNTVDLIIKLLAFLIVIYIVFRIIKTFTGDYRLYRARKKTGATDSYVAFTGIYSFLFSLVDKLDSIILPLLVLKMCQDMPPAQAAIMATLPMTVKSVGHCLGEFVFVPLNRLLGRRRSAVLSVTVCIAMCLAETVCVSAGNIFFFTLAKLILGVFSTGILHSYRSMIPLDTDDTEFRNRAILSNNQGALASTILCALLGGYIMQYVSDVAVYLLNAAVAVPLLFLCFAVFPSRKKERTKVANGAQAFAAKPKMRWSILLVPSVMLILLGFWLPETFIHRYTEYVFPLFADTIGMGAMLLSCLNVFTKTFTYAVSEPMGQFLKRHDRTRTSFAIIIIASVALICTFISSAAVWAVFALFVCEFAYRQLIINANTMIANVISKKNDDSSMQCITISEDVLGTVSKSVIGAMAPLGSALTGAIIGAGSTAIASVCMLIKRAGTKKRTGNNGGKD